MKFYICGKEIINKHLLHSNSCFILNYFIMFVNKTFFAELHSTKTKMLTQLNCDLIWQCTLQRRQHMKLFVNRFSINIKNRFTIKSRMMFFYIYIYFETDAYRYPKNQIKIHSSNFEQNPCKIQCAWTTYIYTVDTISIFT